MENSEKKNKAIQGVRFVVQAAAVGITVAGFFGLIRTMGLSREAFLVSVLLAGLFFCGWICPFGAVQEWLRYIGKNIFKVSIVIPRSLDRYLLWSRYILLVLGIFGIIAIAALDARRSFIMAISGRTLTVAALAVLAVLLLLGLFVERPFCKYLCGFGAIFGLYSIPRVFAVKRDTHTCVDCQSCYSACGMGVEVDRANNVRDPNCINCGKCLAACHTPGALKVGLALSYKNDVVALKNKYIPASQDEKRDS